MSLFCASVVAFAQMAYTGKAQGIPVEVMRQRSAQIENPELRTYTGLIVVTAYQGHIELPLETILLQTKLSCETQPYEHHRHLTRGERTWTD